MVRLGSPEQCRSVTLTTTSALLRVADVMLSQLSHEHESATQQASHIQFEFQNLYIQPHKHMLSKLCAGAAQQSESASVSRSRVGQTKSRSREGPTLANFLQWLQRKQRFADFPVAVPATDKLEKTANFCCFMSKARLLQRYCFVLITFDSCQVLAQKRHLVHTSLLIPLSAPAYFEVAYLRSTLVYGNSAVLLP